MTLNRKEAVFTESERKVIKMCQSLSISKGTKVCSVLYAVFLVSKVYLLGMFWFEMTKNSTQTN